MKKLISICMLIIVLLVGGMTSEARTSHKKKKAKTVSTTNRSNPGSVAGHTFEYGLGFNYSKKWKFNKNGTGTLSYRSYLAGQSNSGSEDFRWKQIGNTVYINNQCLGTVSEDGKTITLSYDEKANRIE